MIDAKGGGGRGLCKTRGEIGVSLHHVFVVVQLQFGRGILRLCCPGQYNARQQSQTGQQGFVGKIMIWPPCLRLPEQVSRPLGQDAVIWRLFGPIIFGHRV